MSPSSTKSMRKLSRIRRARIPRGSTSWASPRGAEAPARGTLRLRGSELAQSPSDPRRELESVAATRRPDHHLPPPLQDEALVLRVRVQAGLRELGFGI